MTATKPRVVYWNNIPSPYIVERFEAVQRRQNLDLQVWFATRTESDRSWDVHESDWGFRYQYLPVLGPKSHPYAVPTPIVTGEPPDVLVSLYAEPHFLTGWWIAKRRGVRTMFWTEVTFDNWVRRRAWKESLKRRIFPRVEGVLTVGHDGRDFALRYGASEDRIFYAPHTIDVEHYKTGRERHLPDRAKVREELGLRGTTFIYVGRLWEGKGLDYLFDAFRVLQRRLEGETSLLLLGDGPEEARLRSRCQDEGIRNVIFAGFQQKPIVPRYYAAADVLVFPTLGDPYGLVVDEAMACSLPVISTSTAGEIRDRIEDGVNGYIVPPKNSAALLDRMEAMAKDPALRRQMGDLSAERIEGHTPEKWASDLEASVERVMSMPRI